MDFTRDANAERAQRYEICYWDEIHGIKAVPGRPLPAYTTLETNITPHYAQYPPSAVNLETRIGPVKLKTPLLSAPMYDVTGATLAGKLAELGACGVIYRFQRVKEQLRHIERALNWKPFLVDNPASLSPDDTIASAKDINEGLGFSTIPIITTEGKFKSVLFTDSVSYDEKHLDDPVSKWMKKVSELKTVDIHTPFSEVQRRLRDEEDCSILPVIDDEGALAGLHFMKDMRHADPAYSQRDSSQLVVGMAIGVGEKDIEERAVPGIEMGVSLIVIDSSHGNCDEVIAQIKRLRKAIGDRQVGLIAGNVADIDGYLRLSAAGADAVKFGIGPGSICSTSIGTGVGYPMFTLIHMANYARECARKDGVPAGDIIADGGINESGDVSVAIAAGAQATMGGKMFVAAFESESARRKGVKVIGELVPYSGEGSEEAIRRRSAGQRYGAGKIAPEGETIQVKTKGPLRKWLPKTLELIRGGVGHTGMVDIPGIQHYCRTGIGKFTIGTAAGIQQNMPRYN